MGKIIEKMKEELMVLIDVVFDAETRRDSYLSTSTFPERIKGYVFEEELLKDRTHRAYRLGIYRNDVGERAIAKRWAGSRRSLASHWMHNEISAYKTLWRIIHSHPEITQRFPRVHIPKLIDTIEQDGELVLLIEYIDGGLLAESSGERKLAAYTDALGFLAAIGQFIGNDEFFPISSRTAWHSLALLPIISVRAIMRHPRLTLFILHSALVFLFRAPTLLKYGRKSFSHRDLGDWNILVREDDIWIIDFQLAAIVQPLFDVVAVSLKLWDVPDFGKAFLKSEYISSLLVENIAWEEFRALSAHLAIYNLSLKSGRNSSTILDFLLYQSKVIGLFTQKDEQKKIYVGRTEKIGLDGALPDSLMLEWDNLWKRSHSANIFNSRSWFVAASQSFSYAEKRIVTIRESATGTLVAVVPLVRRKLYAMPVFVLPAAEFVDRFSILSDLSVDGITEKLLDEFYKLGTVFLSGFIKEDVHKLVYGKKGVSFFITDENPYITYSENQRTNSKEPGKGRSLKRAERSFGHVEFSLVREQHDSALRTAFDIDRHSSKNDRGKGVFWREDARSFFMLLAKIVPQHLYVALLSFAGTPVSMNIGFIHNGVYYCSQKAHLSGYGKYRPGGIAFQKFLETREAENIHEVDIGRGYDSFKMEFTNTVRALYGVVVSRWMVARIYISIVCILRMSLYHFFVGHTAMYRIYREMRMFLISINLPV